MLNYKGTQEGRQKHTLQIVNFYQLFSDSLAALTMPKTTCSQSDQMDVSPKKPKTSSDEPIITIFCLNNDCLAEIFTYLPILDVFRVHESDKRFGEAAQIRYGSGGVYRIDQELIDSVPKWILDCYFEISGRNCRSMKFKGLQSPVILTIFPDFRHLKELILSEINLPIAGENTSVFPTGLESLELDRCNIDEKILNGWIPLLNPTLQSLRICHNSDKIANANFDGLKGLTNLSSLVLEGMNIAFPHVVGELFANNKNQLTSLTMIDVGFESLRIHDDVWTNMMNLDHLTDLRLNYSGFNGEIPRGKQLFPRLTRLEVQFHYDFLAPFIYSLACEGLSTLVLQDMECTGYRVLNSLTRFRSLRHLDLLLGDWIYFESDRWGLLDQLTSLNLSRGSFLDTTQVFDILKNTPFLQKLTLSEVSINESDLDPQEIAEKFETLAKDHKQPFEYEFSIEEDCPYDFDE